MNNSVLYKIIPIVFASLLACGIFFLIVQKRIVILWNSSYKEQYKNIEAVTKKRIAIHFWYNNSWNIEQQTTLMPHDDIQQLMTIGNLYFMALEQYKIINKSVRIHSLSINPSGQEYYLSLDRHPFIKQNSVFEKWMIIQGLLHTLQENSHKHFSYYFLVKNEPLQDEHLDFSHSIAFNLS